MFYSYVAPSCYLKKTIGDLSQTSCTAEIERSTSSTTLSEIAISSSIVRQTRLPTTRSFGYCTTSPTKLSNSSASGLRLINLVLIGGVASQCRPLAPVATVADETTESS